LDRDEKKTNQVQERQILQPTGEFSDFASKFGGKYDIIDVVINSVDKCDGSCQMENELQAFHLEEGAIQYVKSRDVVEHDSY
jgi:hypothetical protein